jgi:hypothetical protein
MFQGTTQILTESVITRKIFCNVCPFLIVKYIGFFSYFFEHRTALFNHGILYFNSTKNLDDHYISCTSSYMYCKVNIVFYRLKLSLNKLLLTKTS